MNETLEQRKTTYLQDLEVKYAPVKASFWKSNVIYHPLLEIAHQSNAVPSDNGVYEFRLEKPVLSLFLFFGLMCFVILAKDELPLLIQFIMPGIFLLIVLNGFLDRRVKLKVDNEGIHFDHNRSLVDWRDIVAVYVKITPDDSDTHEILIHFHDSSTGSFKCETINIDGFDKDYTDICFAIAYTSLKKGKS